MISGFLTSVISSTPTTPACIEERLTLIIDFYHLLRLFSSEAFDKRTNRVSTDVADKHARYIAKLLLGQACRVEESANELGGNGAHRCVDYCFVKRTAIISAAKVRIANARPLMPCSLPREWRPTGHIFLASSCLTPQWGICSVSGNKVDY